VCSAGRPYLYGLGAGGTAGATRALEILRTELERDMALLGAARLSDVTEQMLRRVGEA
jgi:isopentenyl diphosphate isomerase/L-lactate dehydrogenase-like FMN-dependent dehydrogenase